MTHSRGKRPFSVKLPWHEHFRNTQTEAVDLILLTEWKGVLDMDLLCNLSWEELTPGLQEPRGHQTLHLLYTPLLSVPMV